MWRWRAVPRWWLIVKIYTEKGWNSDLKRDWKTRKWRGIKWLLRVIFLVVLIKQPIIGHIWVTKTCRIAVDFQAWKSCYQVKKQRTSKRLIKLFKSKIKQWSADKQSAKVILVIKKESLEGFDFNEHAFVTWVVVTAIAIWSNIEK